MALIYKKFGFNVCSYITNQVSNSKLEVAFCEEASQVEMKRGIHRSQCKDGTSNLNEHTPKSPNTPTASKESLKSLDTVGTPEHGKNTPKWMKSSRMNIQLTEIEAPNFDTDEDTLIQILLEKKLERERQHDAKGKNKVLRGNIGAQRVQQSGEGKATGKTQYKQRQIQSSHKSNDMIYKENESYQCFIKRNSFVPTWWPDFLFQNRKLAIWLQVFSLTHLLTYHQQYHFLMRVKTTQAEV
jgi:hypothetical protein